MAFGEEEAKARIRRARQSVNKIRKSGVVKIGKAVADAPKQAGKLANTVGTEVGKADDYAGKILKKIF